MRHLVRYAGCFFLDRPDNLRLFRAFHEIYAMICNRLEHGWCHEAIRIETMGIQISFDLADCF